MTSIDRSWKIIYPSYINCNKTRAEGRRLKKSECVADPRWQEIRDVLDANSLFRVEAQPNKIYPREVDKELPASRGRIQYQCSDAQFATREAVLRHVASMIPKLKTRAKSAQNESIHSAPQGNNKKKKSKK